MFLSEKNIQTIKDLQADGIKQKQLTKEHLELIYTENWFNLWVPKNLNGLEVDFLEGLIFLRDLAYEDGGLAWTVTLCAGANMFAGFLDPELATQIWQNPKICLGGSGAASGKAKWDGDNYEISGFWKYATGAPHLNYFTLNAEIWEGEQAKLDDKGEKIIRSFLVPKDQVLVHYDWDTFGLECTASHSFSVDRIKVPQNFSFELKPETKTVFSPLFEIPFMCFAELTLAMNYIGMFDRFCDLIHRKLFQKAGNPNVNEEEIGDTFMFLDQLISENKERTNLLTDFALDIWEQVKTSQAKVEDNLLSKVAEKARDHVKWIRLKTAELLPIGGISAAQKEEQLNIVLRNLLTASQHSLLNRY